MKHASQTTPYLVPAPHPPSLSRQRLCVELEAHTELLSAVVSAGHQLPEGAAAGGRPVRRRLTELQTEWDAVCGRLVTLQSQLLTATPAPDGDQVSQTAGVQHGGRGGDVMMVWMDSVLMESEFDVRYDSVCTVIIASNTVIIEMI